MEQNKPRWYTKYLPLAELSGLGFVGLGYLALIIFVGILVIGGSVRLAELALSYIPQVADTQVAVVDAVETSTEWDSESLLWCVIIYILFFRTTNK